MDENGGRQLPIRHAASCSAGAPLTVPAARNDAGRAESAAPVPHAPFFSAFLWMALLVAICAGFAVAGHLSFVLAFGYPLTASFPALVQAHGHAQLLGWCGLLIMGVSLHFIPRLAGAPLSRPFSPKIIVYCVATGLLLRVAAQSALAYARTPATGDLLRGMMLASGASEAIGILLYAILLLDTLRETGRVPRRPGFTAVRPYLGLALGGWLIYAGANSVGLVEMAARAGFALDPGWNRLAIQSFLDLTLLPVALAFSVRLLPLYLGLAAPLRSVRATAYAYLIGAGLQLIPAALDAVRIESGAVETLAGLGAAVKGGTLLWFTWELGLLTRTRPLERPARLPAAGPDRPPTRPGLPDFGEFGRFELLVYSAYVWLVLAAGLEIGRGLTSWLGIDNPVGTGTILHLYLMGFVTLLIFGIAPRMLPGFLRKRRLAAPALVTVTFWLGNLAALARVAPALLPASLLPPAAARIVRDAYGLSGAIALVAVILLAANLIRTARRKGQCPARRNRRADEGDSSTPGPSRVII
jgi:uncharacterized protein involved in response to NO